MGWELSPVASVSKLWMEIVDLSLNIYLEKQMLFTTSQASTIIYFVFILYQKVPERKNEGRLFSFFAKPRHRAEIIKSS